MKKAIRTKFLIDREIQTQIIGYMLVIWLISTLSMVYLVDSAVSAAFRSMIAEPDLFDVAQSEALMNLKDLIRSFGLAGILTALIGSAIGGLFVSHRVAGPIFVLRRAIEQAVETDVMEAVHLRKNDFAKGLAESYNRLVEKINSRKS